MRIVSGCFVSVSGGKKSRGGNLDMDGLTLFLRAKFPQATAAQVGHLIGAPSSTVDKWLRGEARPSLEYYAQMVAVFGPVLVAASLKETPFWLVKAAGDDQKRAIKQQIRGLERELDSV